MTYLRSGESLNLNRRMMSVDDDVDFKQNAQKDDVDVDDDVDFKHDAQKDDLS